MGPAFSHSNTRPVAFRGQLDWRSAGIAAALTLVQFALLLLALQMRVAVSEPPQPMPVILLPTPAPTPPPVPEQPAAEPDLAGGAPAPEIARSLPLAPIVLADPEPVPIAIEQSELALVLPPAVTGPGGTGQGGTGGGTGTGAGSGTGGGGDTAAPKRIVRLSWAPSMRFERLHRYYPDSAKSERIAGLARLDCEIIRGDRVRDCRLLGEAPANYGFGDAALQAEGVYRLQLRERGGKRIYGERIILNAHFRPPPGDKKP